MPACGYEFYLLVFNSMPSLVRHRVDHSKIKFVSTSGHVIYVHYVWTCRDISLWGDPNLDQWSKITRIVEHQRNRWNPSGHGFISSFDAPWSEWTWITDRDKDHLEGTHPILQTNGSVAEPENLDTEGWRNSSKAQGIHIQPPPLNQMSNSALKVNFI